MAYTYKVWIVDGKEHFEYGNGQTRKKDFPFAESLMKLLYLDIWSFADLFEGMGKSIVKLYETKEQQYSDNVEVLCACGQELPCLGTGILAVYGHAVVIALRQAHHFAAPQVNGWKQLHRKTPFTI